MIKVRTAAVRDAEALHRLAEQTAQQGSDASVDDWRSALARADVTVHLAEDNALPVGYAVLVRGALPRAGAASLRLEALAVRPAWRGAGVGTRLMRAATQATATDAATVTAVHPADGDAQGFFRRLGAEISPALSIRLAPEPPRSAAGHAA